MVALLFLSLRPILIPAGLAVFEASAGSEALAAEYLAIRLWGAPAELGIFAVAGWFAGQELTRRLFELQVLQSVLNVAFNLVFVLGLGMDVDGVALGTLIAAYLTFGFGLWRAARRARAIAPPGWRPERARILDRSELIGVMRLNRDIFLRTILLTASLAWIARLGTLQNDTVFAANAVLMQFFFVSAAALDGFAIAAEALVGKAVGARNVVRLRQAVRVSTASAFVLAALFSLVASLLAVPVIHLFTNVPEVRAEAGRYALWATMVPVVGVFAFLLDGIFVGATEARRMRNAMFISAGIFLPGSYLMTLQFGNHGLWAAVLAFFGAPGADPRLRLPCDRGKDRRGRPGGARRIAERAAPELRRCEDVRW